MNPEALRAWEPVFWRAPSAHNTQPWVLRYGADAVEIGWDPACALPQGDPTGRDLRLSLGAFVECCLIACADAGMRVDFRPGHDERTRCVGHLVEVASPYATPFDTSDIRRRTSSRGPYVPGRLPGETFDELDTIAAPGQLRRVHARDLVRTLREADRHQFDSPAVTAELRAWLRLTPRHPRYDQDGLTDRALALNRTEAAAVRAILAPAAYPLLRRLGLARLLAAASGDPLNYHGDVLVLVAPPACGPGDQVTMGRVLFRQWLRLSRLGYATHPLSQIIDCAHTSNSLAELLEVDDPGRLVNITRVGKPVRAPTTSARRR